MSEDNNDLRTELNALAVAICTKASKEAATLAEMTDALKAAAQYYAIREKVKTKTGDDDDDRPAGFSDFSSSINGADRGSSRTPPPHPNSRS